MTCEKHGEILKIRREEVLAMTSLTQSI